MALPFSELSDEEFIETMGVDMGEAVDILFSKLIRAEVMIKTLTAETAQLTEENENLQLREQCLEGEKSNILAEVKQEINKVEALQKK